MRTNRFFLFFLFLVILPISYATTSGSHDVSVSVTTACFGNDTSCGTVTCVNCNALDDYYDGIFCYLGNVVKEYRDYYCDAFECKYTSTYPVFENCTYGCRDDACVYYSGSGGSGGLSYVSGISTSVSEITFSDLVIPSVPEEISSINLPSFSIENTGTADTSFKIQFSCNQYKYCAASWCRADRQIIPLKSNESDIVDIYCIIPEEIEPETDYKMDVFISNTYDDVERIIVTIPTPSQTVIGKELAVRAKKRQATKTTTTIVGVGASILLLWFMIKPKPFKFRRR